MDKTIRANNKSSKVGGEACLLVIERQGQGRRRDPRANANAKTDAKLPTIRDVHRLACLKLQWVRNSKVQI